MTQQVPSITEADGSTVVAAVPDQPVETAAETKARTEAISKANTEAVAWLREAYRDEFNAKKVELIRAAGYDWSPRPTEEQKAAAELEAILTQYPGLRDTLTAPPTTEEPTLPV